MKKNKYRKTVIFTVITVKLILKPNLWFAFRIKI